MSGSCTIWSSELIPIRVPVDSADLLRVLSTIVETESNNDNNNGAILLHKYRVALEKDFTELTLQNKNADTDSIQECIKSCKEYLQILAVLKEWTVTESMNISSIDWSWQTTDNSIESCTALAWEQANIFWNIAALEAYHASLIILSPLERKPALQQAGTRLQSAASYVRYLQQNIVAPLLNSRQETSNNNANTTALSLSSWPNGSMVLSMAVLSSWEAILLAEGQTTVYYFVSQAARPQHASLAKLAAAVVSLTTTTGNTKQDKSQLAGVLETARRANNMAWSAWSEYHQSHVHKIKNEWPLQITRLEVVWEVCNLAREFCQAATDSSYLYNELDQELDNTLQDVKTTLQELEEQHSHEWQHVPDREELPEIPPQITVKIDQNSVGRAIQTVDNNIFAGLYFKRKSQEAQKPAEDLAQVHSFVEQLKSSFYRIVDLSDEETKKAHQALDKMNLPYAITTFQQEQSGERGIPPDLWRRIEVIQKNKVVEELRNDMWSLYDQSELAWSIYKSIQEQMEQDNEMDASFRQQHANYTGHCAADVQNTFRRVMQNYHDLLKSSKHGDSLVMKRLELLDVDPKYKLLRFKKTQLDSIRPDESSQTSSVNVDQLSYYLVVLSGLMDERDRHVQSMQDLAYNRVLEGRKAANFQAMLNDIRVQFDAIEKKIKTNIAMQSDLLNNIADEHEDFIEARYNNEAVNGENVGLSKVIEAVVDIELLSKHMSEGKLFYSVIIPKLEALSKQISNISTRLAIERYEFEDGAQNRQQLEDDARIAASMTTRKESGSVGSNRDNNIEDMNDGAGNGIDDEKVANLVAMGFDPGLAGQILSKHDNNVEDALNELLSV